MHTVQQRHARKQGTGAAVWQSECECAQVVTAEVYCKALSNLIVYVLDRVKPEPSTTSTATVVAIAKLENYLRKSVFGAFNREQPFSAHSLLESTVARWVDGARRDLLDQVRLPCCAIPPPLGANALGTLPFRLEAQAAPDLLHVFFRSAGGVACCGPVSAAARLLCARGRARAVAMPYRAACGAACCGASSAKCQKPVWACPPAHHFCCTLLTSACCAAARDLAVLWAAAVPRRSADAGLRSAGRADACAAQPAAAVRARRHTPTADGDHGREARHRRAPPVATAARPSGRQRSRQLREREACCR
jgi:hypothetical protein